jgi:putative tryptophan/tyrosine transport system substrate-binding protein
MIRRREFIALAGGAAAVWPLAASAQQPIPRVVVIMVTQETDPVGQGRLKALLQGLEKLGWIDGRNAGFDIRWAGGSAERMREIVSEIVALKPDVIVANGTPTVAALRRATSTIPVVFVGINEPVVQGFIASMARPGGNITGWIDGRNVQIVYRWAAGKADLFDRYAAELVALAPDVIVPSGGAAVSPVLNATRTIPVVFVLAPDPVGNGSSRVCRVRVGTRVGVLRDASIHGIGQFAVIQSAAPSVGADVTPISLRDAAQIERDITALAQAGNAGLIVTAAPAAPGHRNLIIGLAARHTLPAVYVERLFPIAGGLVSYGTDFVDQYRRTASYIDRILKGEKPADLPVQAPTKYDLVINLKTAKALGLEIPPTLLVRADEVIE